MPNTPQRLRVFQHYAHPVYFVTFNTYRRMRVLDNASVHAAFLEFAQDGETRGVAIGRYVLMPDHIHLFVTGATDFVLGQWVRSLKRALSNSINESPPHWQE